MTYRILVYGDSMSWGIVPMTRKRFPIESRWPGVMQEHLNSSGLAVYVIEDCLNGAVPSGMIRSRPDGMVWWGSRRGSK